MFRKIRNYIAYRRILKANWLKLESEDFAMTKSVAYQFGTIINMPPDIINMGDDMAMEIVRKYITKVENECLRMGIRELVVLRKWKKIDTFNYQVVFDFYGFNSNWVLLSIVIGALLSLTSILFFL